MSTTKNADRNLQTEAEIRDEIHRLEALMGGNAWNAEKIVSRHIRVLHSYNEAKDAAQALIGKLALVQGSTIQNLHKKYGLSQED